MKKTHISDRSTEELIGEIDRLQSQIADAQRTEYLFTYYYDNIPAFVYVKDTKSNYLFINRKCEELFNVTRKELVDRKYTDYDFFDTEMANQLRENDRLVMETGEFIEIEEIGIPEGKENLDLKAGHRTYLALKFPLKGSDGRPIGVFVFSHDISRQKRLENKLRTTNAELSKALAEIKTLKGIIPICSHCKKIRNDEGFWEQVEVYVRQHTGVAFSHGVCPKCLDEHY